MLDSGARFAAAFLPAGVAIIVGIVLAVRRRTVEPQVARPAVFGLSLHLVAVLLGAGLVVLLPSLTTAGYPLDTVRLVGSAIGILTFLVTVLAWVLLLTALFRRLPARREQQTEFIEPVPTPPVAPAIEPAVDDHAPTGRHALLDDHGAAVVAEEGTVLLPVVGAGMVGGGVVGAGAAVGAGVAAHGWASESNPGGPEGTDRRHPGGEDDVPTGGQGGRADIPAVPNDGGMPGAFTAATPDRGPRPGTDVDAPTPPDGWSAGPPAPPPPDLGHDDDLRDEDLRDDDLPDDEWDVGEWRRDDHDADQSAQSAVPHHGDEDWEEDRYRPSRLARARMVDENAPSGATATPSSGPAGSGSGRTTSPAGPAGAPSDRPTSSGPPTEAVPVIGSGTGHEDRRSVQPGNEEAAAPVPGSLFEPPTSGGSAGPDRPDGVDALDRPADLDGWDDLDDWDDLDAPAGGLPDGRSTEARAARPEPGAGTGAPGATARATNDAVGSAPAPDASHGNSPSPTPAASPASTPAPKPTPKPSPGSPTPRPRALPVGPARRSPHPPSAQDADPHPWFDPTPDEDEPDSAATAYDSRRS